MKGERGRRGGEVEKNENRRGERQGREEGEEERWR